MLRIGYDVTPLVGMCTGVGNYTRQLLRHMLDRPGEHDFLLMANRAEALRDVAPSARARPMVRSFPSRLRAKEANARPTASPTSGVRSVPTTPRMSYCRKIAEAIVTGGRGRDARR